MFKWILLPHSIVNKWFCNVPLWEELLLSKAVHLIFRLRQLEHALHLIVIPLDIHKHQLLLPLKLRTSFQEHPIKIQLFNIQFLNSSIFQMHHAHFLLVILRNQDQVQLKEQLVAQDKLLIQVPDQQLRLISFLIQQVFKVKMCISAV